MESFKMVVERPGENNQVNSSEEVFTFSTDCEEGGSYFTSMKGDIVFVIHGSRYSIGGYNEGKLWECNGSRLVTRTWMGYEIPRKLVMLFPVITRGELPSALPQFLG